MSKDDTTFQLLARARAGDASALDTLFARYLPPLRRWASGRLPRWARDMSDTQDLVQDTLLQTFKRIESFEPRNEGALQAYLRQAVMNRIRDEIRRRQRRPESSALDSQQPDETPSPLEQAIGQQAIERYEAALLRLQEEDRELVIGRIELGLSYGELADAVGKPSPEAARKAAQRALLRLIEEMNRGGCRAVRRRRGTVSSRSGGRRPRGTAPLLDRHRNHRQRFATRAHRSSAIRRRHRVLQSSVAGRRGRSGRGAPSGDLGPSRPARVDRPGGFCNRLPRLGSPAASRSRFETAARR